MLQTKTPAGARDAKIRIDRPVIVDGSANSDIVDHWEEVLSTWAEVTNKQGYEQYEAQRLTSESATVFNIRYRAGITAKMRVVYQGAWYRIFSIKPIGRKMEMELATDFIDNEVVT